MLDLLKTHQDGYTDPSLAAMDELCMDFCVKGIQFLFFIDRCCLHDEEEEGKLTVGFSYDESCERRWSRCSSAADALLPCMLRE